MAWTKRVWFYIRATRPKAGPGISLVETPSGTIISLKNGKGGSSKTLCPFGEITSWVDGETTKTGIRGGVCYAGDKNFNVTPYELDLETDGVWLAYMNIQVEVNRDDDNEIILPGIKTSPETNPSTFWGKDTYTDGPPATQYPDNGEPTVDDGMGNIIVPIGKLTIAGGSPVLAPVACGNVTLGQCGGILSHTRG